MRLQPLQGLRSCRYAVHLFQVEIIQHLFAHPPALQDVDIDCRRDHPRRGWPHNRHLQRLRELKLAGRTHLVGLRGKNRARRRVPHGQQEANDGHHDGGAKPSEYDEPTRLYQRLEDEKHHGFLFVILEERSYTRFPNEVGIAMGQNHAVSPRDDPYLPANGSPSARYLAYRFYQRFSSEILEIPLLRKPTHRLSRLSTSSAVTSLPRNPSRAATKAPESGPRSATPSVVPRYIRPWPSKQTAR